MKEEELTTALRQWLLREGWEVYHEVVYLENRADLVATRQGRLWVFEAKTSLSFALIEQAERWEGLANLVSVCVPAPSLRRQPGRGVAIRTLDRSGIGLVEVTTAGKARC